MEEIFAEYLEQQNFSLEGERVLLRKIEARDAENVFFEIEKSRNFLAEFLPWPFECQALEDVLYRIDSWNVQADLGAGACFGIFKKDTLEFLGMISVGWIQWKNKTASLSFWLGASFCGKGYASEALVVLSAFLLRVVKLNRLEITASKENVKSAAVARRAGFVFEGVRREFEFINGRFLDHESYALLARDLEKNCESN